LNIGIKINERMTHRLIAPAAPDKTAMRTVETSSSKYHRLGFRIQIAQGLQYALHNKPQ
jgi:hypothetical protein